jgi:hypothetical protein
MRSHRERATFQATAERVAEEARELVGEVPFCETNSSRRLHFQIDAFAEFEADALHFVVELKPHPKALFHAEESGQAEVVFRGATTAAVLHFGEVGGKNAGGFRNVFLSGGPLIQGFTECLGEGVGKRHGFHGISVVVDDLNLVGMVVFPYKNDPPLLIDPDAVKIAQVAGQFLKTVARRNPQVVQF